MVMIRAHLLTLSAVAVLFACGSSSDPGADAKTKSLGDQVNGAVDSAKKMLDPKTVSDSSFSIDKLKESMNSLSPDNLKEIANNLVASIKSHTESGKADASNLIKSLKDKLQVVVDKLKASGQDVSQYTPALSG
jgi:hypothetical protein